MNRMTTFFFVAVALATAAAPAAALHEKTTEDRIDILSSRIEAIEKARDERAPADWFENVTLSGLIEADASYSVYDPAGPGPNDEVSDIILSTMEFGVDAAVNEFMSGHILFLWEEDETEPVDLDEAFVSISGGGLPVYLNAGKLYVPFGVFESRFISDPLTLELGETNESAVFLGIHAGGFDIGTGAFNGDSDEADQDDHIDDLVARAAYTPSAFAGVDIQTAVSYISDISDTDALSDAIAAPNGIADSVEGFSTFFSASAGDRVFLIAEYIGALEYFAAGELSFAAGRVRPRAWNLELAYLFQNACGIGAKYEGTEDCGDFLPEVRYGAIIFCQPVENTFFGVEYLDEQFENHDGNNAVTAQLAYTF